MMISCFKCLNLRNLLGIITVHFFILLKRSTADQTGDPHRSSLSDVSFLSFFLQCQLLSNISKFQRAEMHHVFYHEYTICSSVFSADKHPQTQSYNLMLQSLWLQ